MLCISREISTTLDTNQRPMKRVEIYHRKKRSITTIAEFDNLIRSSHPTKPILEWIVFNTILNITQTTKTVATISDSHYMREHNIFYNTIHYSFIPTSIPL